MPEKEIKNIKLERKKEKVLIHKKHNCQYRKS
jgi:hypothetical protein